MTPYANLSKNSGVLAYEIGKAHIAVLFRHEEAKVYEYDSKAPGKDAVEEMKKLAAQGRGLSTYISQHVRDRYARIKKRR